MFHWLEQAATQKIDAHSNFSRTGQIGTKLRMVDKNFSKTDFSILRPSGATLKVFAPPDLQNHFVGETGRADRRDFATDIADPSELQTRTIDMSPTQTCYPEPDRHSLPTAKISDSVEPPPLPALSTGINSPGAPQSHGRRGTI